MPALSKLVVATAGTLPHDTSRIKKWIEANGGTYTTTPNKHTTHLVASKDAYKKPHPAVQRASELGIWIVSFDWLDDSLQAGRKLSAKKYTWDALRKEKRKRKQVKRVGEVMDGKKFREGCERIKRLTGSGTLKQGGATRTKKKSKSFFFGGELVVPDVPFVSAGDDLKRRRKERDDDAVAASERQRRGQSQSQSTIASPTATSIPSTTSSSNSSPSLSSAPSSHPSPCKSPTPTPTSSSCPSTLDASQAKKPHWKDLYHYYMDSTGFEYKLVLARTKLITNSFARYHVGLLESHAKPHTYCVIVQYTPPADDTGGEAPSPAPALGNGNRKITYNEALSSTLAAQIHTLNTDSSALKSDFPTHTQTQAQTQTHLQSLISPPSPSQHTPYTTLLTPHHSPYPLAFTTFRHTFRTLTHLTWEERFHSASRDLQAQRAQQLGIEPYLWKKPEAGLPMGLLPQVGVWAGDGMGSGDGEGKGEGVGTIEAQPNNPQTYTRNPHNLPGVDETLSATGVIGSWLLAERERRQNQDEERERAREKGVGKGRRKQVRDMSCAHGKKESFNRPFFNGVSGTPPKVEAGRSGSATASGTATTSATLATASLNTKVKQQNTVNSSVGIPGLGARVRRRVEMRPFPRQREG
ncbi:hypothetical protein J1614_008821 [Plenodomus biglobosus]|nr:hypothetical protein J1614_008821 [Plenodomus biglobosus]